MKGNKKSEFTNINVWVFSVVCIYVDLKIVTKSHLAISVVYMEHQ